VLLDGRKHDDRGGAASVDEPPPSAEVVLGPSRASLPTPRGAKPRLRSLVRNSGSFVGNVLYLAVDGQTK
jgi:hypothetical protein